MKSRWSDNKNNVWEVTPGKNGCSIALLEASDAKIAIPKECSGQAVIEIEKKGFLSKKEIKEIVIPDTVERIGDWAFSHAMDLEKLVIQGKNISFGRKLFLGCNRLRYIYVSSEDDTEARMIAIGVRFFEDDKVLSDFIPDTKEWYKRWDELLIKFIEKDDLEGFMELWTCGEEDYEGKDYDVASYPVERRYEKLRIIYFRLMNNRMLSEATKEKLNEYIRCFSKGKKTEEAWDIVVNEFGDDLDVYHCLVEAGGLNPNNFNNAFLDVQDKNAQVKAYLLKWKKENINQKPEMQQADEFDLGW